MSRGTRTRMATHSSGIVPGGQCPRCPSHHVVEHKVKGRPLRMCGLCGHTWEPRAEERAAS